MATWMTHARPAPEAQATCSSKPRGASRASSVPLPSKEQPGSSCGGGPALPTGASPQQSSRGGLGHTHLVCASVDAGELSRKEVSGDSESLLRVETVLGEVLNECGRLDLDLDLGFREQKLDESGHGAQDSGWLNSDAPNQSQENERHIETEKVFTEG
ncbi:hypothetical protein MUG91_G127n23 [Manis pentadactyla]|nr:hypothetical protein MUG91_G127n23 [Manis pentadactyla]